MKTLHLTLKKKWFDMIASGEKTEEYRELKSYWGVRLLNKIEVPWGGYLTPWKDIERGDFTFKGWSAFVSPNAIFEKFDWVQFRNGYSKDAPYMLRHCAGIEIREGRPEWGAEPGKKYFVIKLGERIDAGLAVSKTETK